MFLFLKNTHTFLFRICICLLFLLQVSLTSWSQSAREVYGSFEAGCKVYNYHFKQEANQINSFSISELGHSEKRWNLNTERVNATIKNLDSLASLKTKPDGMADSTWTLVTNLTVLHQALKAAVTSEKDITQLVSYQEKLKQLESSSVNRNVDSLLKVVLNKQMDTSGYKVMETVKAITALIKHHTGSDAPTYLSFNDLKIEVFKGVFEKLIKEKEPFFDPVCKYERNDLTNRVFYEIKARLDFTDDEPTTAYLKLRTNKLKVYLQKNDGTNSDKKIRKWTANNNRLKAKINYLNALLKDTVGNNQKDKQVIDFAREELEERNKAYAANEKNILERQLEKGYLPFINSKGNDGSLEMEVDNVSVEFEDGTIKNLFVDLSYVSDSGVRTPLRFRNDLPISISSKFDPDAFENHIIFAGTPCVLYRAIRGRGVTAIDQMQKQTNVNRNNNCLPLYFMLSDLIDYQILAQSDKEDFSPANQVYQVNSQNPTQQLKKELRSKILNVRFYSDLVGVQDDEPNGLIQIEASKRINLKTTKIQTGPQAHFGGLTYIEPKVTLRKIERNNKYLFLNRNNLDSSNLEKEGIRYQTDPLSLMQYANFSLTTDLNLIRAYMPRYKANWHINFQAGVFRTAVADTLTISDSTSVDGQTENINSGMVGMQVMYELKPESRYGAIFGLEVRYLHPFNNKYMVPSNMQRFISTIWFEGFLKTNNDNGRLFFRTRFNQLIGKWNQNFMQIQLGYAVNLFKSNG